MNSNIERIISFYKSELDNKNREIEKLNTLLQKVTKEKQDLLSTIEILKIENYNIKKNYETNIEISKRQYFLTERENKEQKEKMFKENKELRERMEFGFPSFSKFNTSLGCYSCKENLERSMEEGVLIDKQKEVLSRLIIFVNKINQIFNSQNEKLKRINLKYNDINNFYYLRSILEEIENSIYEKAYLRSNYI
ncbi:MAG: hypothetical protein MJ252_25095 [archaeon]|nr:hypothetical protein [archaeon]